MQRFNSGCTSLHFMSKGSLKNINRLTMLYVWFPSQFPRYPMTTCKGSDCCGSTKPCDLINLGINGIKKVGRTRGENKDYKGVKTLVENGFMGPC